MDESEFNHTVDELLTAIEDAIEDSGAEIDFEIAGGILSLSFEDHSKIIINRQTPLRQLWLATRSGGFHFNFDATYKQWHDEKTGAELLTELNRHCSIHAGEDVVLVL